ncbi:MAG: zinc ribbon domain-containing protein [Oscillospiraceae bacterium]|nr:zinc ribbon domain-containing protein [Oscillospiraceae bacterium]
MSFLDKLSANVTNAGRIGSQKIKNISEANSLSNEQRQERRNIQETMNEIARLYFEKYKNDPNAEFAEQIASIKTSEKHIAELQAQIEEVRAREPELVFVPEEPKVQRTPTAMVCMQCGHSYPAGETTCKNCGYQLIPQHGNIPKGAAEPQPQTVAENWYSQPEQAADAAKTEAPEQPETPAQPSAAGNASAGEQSSARFCAYCGKPCLEGQAFCANCGKKL